MLRGHVHAGARHGDHRDRQLRRAAEHVAHLRHLVGDLVHALAHEIHEHDVDHRPQSGGGGADPEADDAFLRNRRVHHPVGSELVEQAPIGTEYAAGAGHVLAGDECGVLLCEDFPRPLGDGRDVGYLAPMRSFVSH